VFIVSIYRINVPSVVSETIDGEVIIINLEAGYYYSVDSAAGVQIWSWLEAGQSFDTILSALLDRYAASADSLRAALSSFIDQLTNEGLIVPDASALSSAAIPAHDGATRAFQAPMLQKFTDMQDLLLLDPIHEVDESGWPRVPQTAQE